MATENIVGKGELAHQIAARSGLSLKDAEKALDAFTEVVPENLAQGREVRLIGFGSWRLREVAGWAQPSPKQRKRPRGKARPQLRNAKAAQASTGSPHCCQLAMWGGRSLLLSPLDERA